MGSRSIGISSTSVLHSYVKDVTHFSLLEVHILNCVGVIVVVIGNSSIVQAELVGDDIDYGGLDIIGHERGGKVNSVAIGLKTRVLKSGSKLAQFHLVCSRRTV